MDSLPQISESTKAIMETQTARLNDFLSFSVPNLIDYVVKCFLIGIASMSLVILIMFGIFKAMSFFQELASF